MPVINRMNNETIRELLEISMKEFSKDLGKNESCRIRYDLIRTEVTRLLCNVKEKYAKKPYLKKKDRFPANPIKRFNEVKKEFEERKILCEEEIMYAATILGFAGDRRFGELYRRAKYLKDLNKKEEKELIEKMNSY